MANVVFSFKGKNYQVPGLPYEETFTAVMPIIFDDVPSREEIVEILDQAPEGTLVNPWSLPVIKGFKDYIPTTFKRVTQDMPRDQFSELFDVETDWIPESEKILLQLQTEIEAKAATIDAALIHYRRELGTVVNKAHVANRLYMIGSIYKHLVEREYPFLFGDLLDHTTWDRALSDMKMMFIDFMKEVPLGGSRQYEQIIRRPDVEADEIKERFGYLEWLKEKLGDDLLGVLLYGSAARTDDPDQYSDFDNWVKVKDVRRAHAILRGTCPEVVDNKVIEGCGDIEGEIEGAKHLGIHIFPDDDDYILRHIRFLHDPEEFRLHTRVLYGEFPFVIVAPDEIIERGISQAYIKLKTIAGSLNWAWNAPEKILGKPSLYEFIVKNLRFFMQHSLNALEGPKFRNKQLLNELLGQRGIFVPDYRPDLEYIRKSLVYAMQSVLVLQKELVEAWKPKLDFLVETESRPAYVEDDTWTKTMDYAPPPAGFWVENEPEVCSEKACHSAE